MARIINRFLRDRSMGLSGVRQFDRFMLWIDAVGGYWVCLGDEVTIGQPSWQGTADVPILGDLSSRHALIRRDGEEYLIEALREVYVDGSPVDNVGWLRNRSRIQLGRSVQLLFRRPHALSGTARLDFLSRHRTQPAADAVLLMADTCILGPKRHCHVVCPEWTRELVLYRHEGELYCRAAGPFEIDGVACVDRGRIIKNSRIQGEGFSVNLEAIKE
jgi:pSer/pThr/pTyr-binding forkhead associated (FHA) protein